MDEQRQGFLKMESTGEDAVETVETATKDLEQLISLVDKAAAGLRRWSPILKGILWVKCYQTAAS